MTEQPADGRGCTLPVEVLEANQRRADEIVAGFPPLTGEQLAGLADIFRPGPDTAKRSRSA